MNSKWLLSSSAIVLFMIGIVINFAPQEIAIYLGFSNISVAALVLQITAGLFLGMGAVNWMSKGITMGGIYARPLAMGNMLHFVVGSFALGKTNDIFQSAPVFLILFVIYLLLALGFVYTVFFSSPGVNRAKATSN